MKAHLLIFAAVLLVPCWTKPTKPKPGASASKAGASASKAGASASKAGASASKAGASASKAGASASKAGPSASQNLDPITLDMAPESVDADYRDCPDDMETQVENKYFKNENVGDFARYWSHQTITECLNKGNNVLTKNQRQAICLYTSKYMAEVFNKAVRTSKNIYGSSFKFHYLHYWLTTAIQKLNKIQKTTDCPITYRRSKHIFTGKEKDTIRFGEFASSSTRPDLTKYGSETCFKITTCSGASVGDYSIYPKEKEVIIPPYETFNITSTNGKRQGALSDCQKLYVLKSAGEQSELKCKLVRQSES
ncbi:ecto-ADP-ribosyltransferase 4-like [Thunnus maccoyii]|uniref:ecto-ADP-ribosyltransferase 4-like n=1 Tax=Thunnus maccoyii TaxID=8240 RepID=UPI001C4D6E60|nr:ecto-ADP-ribosyltransferase 4-like [Thunnus maccoyii]